MNNFSDKRVVVTGIGTINPLGNNVEEYWDKLANGVSGIRTCQHSDLSDYHINIAGEVDFPNLTPYFSKRKYIKRFDRFILHTGVCRL